MNGRWGKEGRERRGEDLIQGIVLEDYKFNLKKSNFKYKSADYT